MLVKKSPPFIQKPKVYYHIHKSPPQDHILSQMNQVHTLTPSFCKIPLNLICTYVSQVISFLQVPQSKIHMHFSFLPGAARLIVLDLIIVVFTEV